MFGFDKMFDFNRDGRLNAFERAAQFQFMDEMLKNGESGSFDDDDVRYFEAVRIRKKEEKYWKTQDWIQMSLIFRFIK